MTGPPVSSTNARRSQPFLLLVRLFASRIFHASGNSEDSELDLGIGLILGLLALPGAFYSLFLMEKYSTLLQWMRGQHELDPLAGALPDEYFFIVLSMAVTGVVAVWRWDAIFPDRRDYSNLVPLPISLRSIFFANFAAISMLAVLLALDVNAASAILFPLIVSASENTFTFFLHFVGIHLLVLVLASVFSFCAVFVMVGVLMIAVPYAAFRQVSFYLRALILACFVAMFATSFAVPPMLRLLPNTAARFLPPVWFLGLCQLLRGRTNESWSRMGHVALISLASVLIAGIAVYLLSYRRCFLRISETTDVARTANSDRGAWFFRIADRTFLRTPFQRAGYRFAIKTLARSEHHGLVLGGFFGLGIVVAGQFLFTSWNGADAGWHGQLSPDILAIPLALSYCILVGLRLAFEFPAELRSNWTFRIQVDHTTPECSALAQRLMLTFVLPWSFTLVLPLYVFGWGWRTGLVHTIVVALCSILLTGILLRNFRKIPFTCSYPPFKQSSLLLVLFCVIGFFAYVTLISHVESWALHSGALASTILVALLALASFIVPRIGQENEMFAQGPVFEGDNTVAFELLDLRRGS